MWVSDPPVSFIYTCGVATEEGLSNGKILKLQSVLSENDFSDGINFYDNDSFDIKDEPIF